MFLHIGTDVEILKKDIIAIMDLDSIYLSKTSMDFFDNYKKKGKVYSISEDKPKSIVIVNNNKDTSIYLSPISSVTLQKRIDFVQSLM
jgi:hypothetical protein